MATGKTNTRHQRIYADGVDLSGVMRTYGSAGITYNEEEVTGWSDGVINHAGGLGRPQAFIQGLQSVFDNTANGAHAELSALEEYITSLHIGIRAAPAIQDPAFGCNLGQSSYVVQGDGPVLVDWELNGPHQDDTIPDKVWGYVMYPSTSISSTTTASSVDLGAAQANGCIFLLHVLSADAGDTWTLTVEESSDDGAGDAFATIVTFNADGQTALGEQAIDTTSVEQYVRFVATAGASVSGATFAVTVIPQ